MFLQLSAYLELPDDGNKHFVAKLMTYVFLTVGVKLPIRKTIVRILVSSQLYLIEIYLVEHLKMFINDMKNKSDTSHLALEPNEVFGYIMSCLDNFAPGLRAVTSVAEEVFHFTFTMLQQYTNRLL